jgi:hypothetical protein
MHTPNPNSKHKTAAQIKMLPARFHTSKHNLTGCMLIKGCSHLEISLVETNKALISREYKPGNAKRM